jgi:hypothetical protein
MKEAAMRAAMGRVLALALLLLPAMALAGEAKFPDLEDTKLSIPWKDFKPLLEMAKPKEEKKAEVPPMEYALSEADYQGRLEPSAAAIDATLRFTSLAVDKWVMVPVLPAELALESLKLDDAPATAMSTNAWHWVMVFGPGAHTVTCRFYSAFANELGPANVSFPLAKTAVTTLAFTVAEPGLEIKAVPASVNRMTYPAGASALFAALPPTDRVTISWSKKVEAAEAELRMNAAVETLVSLGEKLCQVESVVHYEILHRGVTGFELTLPKGVAVVDVAGVGLADWKATEQEDKQFIKVKLSYEAKGAYDLRLSYETALPEATAEIAAPELTALGLNRETGFIGVAAKSNIEVGIKDNQNLNALDVSQLPPDIAARSGAPLLYAFKYLSHPFALTLQATKHEDVKVLSCAIDQARLLTFITADGKVLTRAVYAIRNNTRQFLRLQLPEGARVLGAFRSSTPIKPSSDGKFTLLPLEKAVAASGEAISFTIEVTYLLDQPEFAKHRGELSLIAPKADLIANNLEWTVYAPPGYRYEKEDATLERRKVGPESTVMSTDATTRSSGKGSMDTIDTWVVQTNEAYENYQRKNIDDQRLRRDQRVPKNEKRLDKLGKEHPVMDLSGSVSPGGADLDGSTKTSAATDATLPVRFEVPEKGARMVWEKSIIKEDEDNHIRLKYSKPILGPAKLRGAVALGTLGLLVIALVALALVARRKIVGIKQPKAGVSS